MLLKIELVYCAVWNYTGRAAGLAVELLEEFEPEIESLTIVPSDGGRFEISVNGQLLYSKLQTRRHAEPGEVVKLVQKYQKDQSWVGRDDISPRPAVNSNDLKGKIQ